MKLEKYYKGDKFKVKADGMLGNHVVHAGDVLCVQRTERATGDEDAVLFCELQDGSVIRESMSVLEDCTEPLFYIGEGTALARSLVLLSHKDVTGYEGMSHILFGATVVASILACLMAKSVVFMAIVPVVAIALAFSRKGWNKRYDTAYQSLAESKTEEDFLVAKNNAEKCLRRVRRAGYGMNLAASLTIACNIVLVMAMMAL